MKIKKNVKKVVSVVLALAMVVTSVTAYNVKTAKAEETLASMVANENGNYNLAKGGEVSYLHTRLDGGETTPDKITDGSFTTPHCAINDANDNWGAEGGETYVIVDLGKTYEAANIDQIVIGYKDGAENDTVLTRSYSISYSSDGEAFTTVVDNRTVEAFDNTELNATIDNVKGIAGNVRWVKVSYPVTANYGMQLKEIAVLDTDLDVVEAKLDAIANPKDFSVTDVMGEITLNVIPDENQEGFQYYIYVDDVKKATVSANQDYTIKALKVGQHIVKVVSSHKGAESVGLTKDITISANNESKVTDSNVNVAFGKEYEIFRTNGTNESAEGVGNITNGIIESGSADYVTAEQNTQGTYFTIDLGKLYVADSIDRVVVWFRDGNSGTQPGENGYEIRYSTDNTTFETVATVTKAEFDMEKEMQDGVPFASSANISNVIVDAVRYVQIYVPDAVVYGIQLTEMAVFDIDNDLEEAAGETYTVTIDGVENEAGSTFKLPATDNIKTYYSVTDKTFYKPNTYITVNKDMELVTISDIAANLTNGAAIRIDENEKGGIRFRAKVSVTCGLEDKKDEIINNIQSGMLITTKDILENADNLELTVENKEAIGTVVNVENKGWYNNDTGLYCVSLINILEANYTRTFVARAYVKIPYATGDEYVYSVDNGQESANQVERTIQSIASRIMENAAVFNGYSEEQQNAIKKFAGLE